MRGHVIVGAMTISTDVDKLYDTDLTDAAWAHCSRTFAQSSLMPNTKVASSRATCCARTAGSCRSSNAGSAFKITGLTWIVERSFAWLGRNRRLSKDYEYCVQSSETLIEIAATRLMLNRLAQA